MIKYLSIIPIALYLIFVVYKYGIQKSISESYYRLTNKQKPIFFFALVSTSLLFIIGYEIENIDQTLQIIILFLAASGICYTAAAAAFKDDNITSTVHVIGAVSGYILGYLFIVSVWLLDSIFFIIPSLILMWIISRYEEKKEATKKSYYGSEYPTVLQYINKSVWWFEVIGLITIYLASIL